MTLYAGGISFLLLALTYYVVDVRGWHKGLDWLKIYGMNAITAYVVSHVFDFSSVSESLLYSLSAFPWYPVLIAFANASIVFGLLCLLYRKRIFLKV